MRDSKSSVAPVKTYNTLVGSWQMVINNGVAVTLDIITDVGTGLQTTNAVVSYQGKNYNSTTSLDNKTISFNPGTGLYQIPFNTDNTLVNGVYVRVKINSTYTQMTSNTPSATGSYMNYLGSDINFALPVILNRTK